MDHDIREGDVCKIYFGGATDDGVGEALIEVTEVGDVVIGDTIQKLQKMPDQEYRVMLSDSTWRIDTEQIHAVHHYPRDAEYKRLR